MRQTKSTMRLKIGLYKFLWWYACKIDQTYRWQIQKSRENQQRAILLLRKIQCIPEITGNFLLPVDTIKIKILPFRKNHHLAENLKRNWWKRKPKWQKLHMYDMNLWIRVLGIRQCCIGRHYQSYKGWKLFKKVGAIVHYRPGILKIASVLNIHQPVKKVIDDPMVATTFRFCPKNSPTPLKSILKIFHWNFLNFLHKFLLK